MFSIYADGQSIYYPTVPHMKLLTPKLTLEMGKAGSLSFNIPPTHPFLNTLHQLKTKMTVEMDGTEIFRGRILQINRGFNNTRSVYCEGDLAYLVDSVIKGEKFSGQTHTLFRNILMKHNARVEDGKKFTQGMLTIENRPIVITGQSDETYDQATDTKDYKQIAVNSIVDEWMTSYDYIENSLIEYCGGYLRTRRIGDTVYLDLITDYEHDAAQEIVFGRNLLDLSEETSVDDLMTVLIPIGDENLTIEDLPDTNNLQVSGVTGIEENRFVKDGDEIIDTVAVQQYGRIVKTHVFENVNQKSTLLENGLRFIANHENMPMTITVKAVDMSFVNPSATPISVGDRVRVKSRPHDLTDYLTCTKIEYDLEKPANNAYTFGNPKQTLTQRYRRDKNKEQKSRGGGGGAAAAAGATSEESENKAETDVYNAWVKADPESGRVTLGATYEKLENAIRQLYAECGIDLSANPEEANVNIHSLYQSVENNSSSISNIWTKAGEDFAQVGLQAAISNKITADLTDASVASVILNAQTGLGTAITANAQNILTNTGNITNLTGRVSSVEGSAVYQHGAAIDAVAGKFEIDENGVLHVIEGSGLQLDGNGSSFGVYTEGNLTAGVIVEKINEDSSVKINGNRIYLNAGQTGEVNIVSKVTSIESAYTNLVNGQTTASALHATSLTAVNETVSGTLTVNGTLQADGHNVVGRNIYMDGVEPGGVTFFGSLSSNVDLSHHHNLTITDNNDGTFTVEIGTCLSKSSSGNTANFSIAATQYYQNGVAAARNSGYNSGWAGAWGLTGLSSAQSTSNQMTVYLPPQSPVANPSASDRVALNLTVAQNGTDASGNPRVDITIGGTTYARTVVTAGSSTSYNEGWEAARSKVAYPTTASSSSSFSFSYPPTTVDGTAAVQNYYLTADSALDSNGTSYAYVHVGSTGGTVVARVSTLSLYRAGWDAAAGKVLYPTAVATGTSIQIRVPQAGNYTGYQTLQYDMSQDSSWTNNKKYVYIKGHTITNTFARVEVDASGIYTNGANSVTVSSSGIGGWSNGSKTVTLSNSKTHTVSLVAADLTDWSHSQMADFATSHKYSVSFKVCGRSFSGQVDASTAYNGGYTACENTLTAVASTTGTANAWSNYSYTVAAGQTITRYVYVKATAGSKSYTRGIKITIKGSSATPS